jgi:hypothetical protein
MRIRRSAWSRAACSALTAGAVVWAVRVETGGGMRMDCWLERAARPGREKCMMPERIGRAAGDGAPAGLRSRRRWK